MTKYNLRMRTKPQFKKVKLTFLILKNQPIQTKIIPFSENTFIMF